MLAQFPLFLLRQHSYAQMPSSKDRHIPVDIHENCSNVFLNTDNHGRITG
jgi:hypothetical protein